MKSILEASVLDMVLVILAAIAIIVLVNKLLFASL